MMNQKTKPFFRPANKLRIAAVLFGLTAILADGLMKRHPEFVEKAYGLGFYPIISTAASLPARFIPQPVSASEILIGLSVVAFMIWFGSGVYRLLTGKSTFKRSFCMFLFNLAAVFMGGVFIHLAFWGMNYQRPPVSKYLKTHPGHIAVVDYLEMTRELAIMADQAFTGMLRDEYSFDLSAMDEEVDSALEDCLFRLYPSRSAFLKPPPTKMLFGNRLLNLTGVSGIFLPISMEPHINRDLLAWEIPFIAAHEKAHYLGFASETDANLIAYLACLNASSDEVRYSGAMSALIALSRFTPLESRKQIILEHLHPEAVADFRSRRERMVRNYNRYKIFIIGSSHIYDVYLRSNSQSAGIDSYRMAVPHLADWWKHRGRRFSLTNEARNKARRDGGNETADMTADGPSSTLPRTK